MKLGVFRAQYALCFYIGFMVLVVAGFAEVLRRRAAAGALIFLVVAGGRDGDSRQIRAGWSEGPEPSFQGA